ncbi:MAG: hypothetical protein A2Z20_12760 [Bdellovibrionales bacterium RBG_16_40_8]|nr:MAG: hypothetical protein A2Z20_12760 [Bdellovibrionales bacterium RBG_16_40_8]
MTKEKNNLFYKAILAIHQASSVAEIETSLHEKLSEPFHLDWLRIFTHSGEHVDMQLERIKDLALYKSTLTLGSHQIGKIVFARKNKKTFSKSEQKSLHELSESVSMALDRLTKLDQAETLKLQWESTFNAISEPLCLTDEKFHILKINHAFLKATGKKQPQVLGINCFTWFSNPNAYEVTSQRIQTGSESSPILLVMFRDITEQKKIEKQIFESAKMAELGTIGSSIAHDINNPLGGMLNFLQLIKMDLKSDDPIREDIEQMEDAGLRCKEIVENLLRFSRREEAGSEETISINDIIDQALKIIELQTRSLGINVEVTGRENEYKILGNINHLSQALSHIFQNAFDAVSEKLNRHPGFKGYIKIDVLPTPSPNGITIIIKDNGVGITPEHQSKILNPLFTTKINKKNRGLGLTLAFQIINEHGGQLDISSQPNVGTTVKISFINV